MSGKATASDLSELVRRANDAGSRRDIDAFLALCHPDFLMDNSAVGLGRFEGADAFRAFAEDWYAAYDEYTIVSEAVLDLGGGVAFAITRQKGRLRGSGRSVELRDAHVLLFEEGLLRRWTAYPDAEQARRAAERLAKERV
jgi:ketosteroid isomerase-like protein